MKEKRVFAVLIVAAGYSSRMKTFKPLLNFHRQNALLHLIDTYTQAGVESIYVVTGYRHDEIVSALSTQNVHIVYNEAFDQGMFSSVQAGLRAMQDVHAFFMQPVDIPLIKTSTIVKLRDAYEQKNKGIVYPVFLDKKGHPTLIDMVYKERILQDKGEGGLKKVLETLSENSLHVSVCDQAVLMDMDTPKDYEALRIYEAMNAPSPNECLAIMLEHHVPEHIIKHCEAVGKKACDLYARVASYGIGIDKNTLFAAALLHDIARLEKNHAHVGAHLLKNMGYDAIGELIQTHMDINVEENASLNAAELLFLADKLVGEDQECGLEERFAKTMKKCEGNENALQNIRNRLISARRIVRKIEKLTGEMFYVD